MNSWKLNWKFMKSIYVPEQLIIGINVYVYFLPPIHSFQCLWRLDGCCDEWMELKCSVLMIVGDINVYGCEWMDCLHASMDKWHRWDPSFSGNPTSSLLSQLSFTINHNSSGCPVQVLSWSIWRHSTNSNCQGWNL